MTGTSPHNEPTIAFRGMEPSQGLIDAAHSAVKHLEDLHPQILSCRVLVESQHHHGPKGSGQVVSVHVRVPGRFFSVSKASPEDTAHPDAYIAMNEAFQAAQRVVGDFFAKRRSHSG